MQEQGSRMLGAGDFAGNWEVTRVIDDRRAGQTGHFAGAAVLTPDGAGLRYDEAGRLRLGDGAAFEARRAYLWRFDPQGVAMLFDDGRPFHRFVPAGRVAGTDHPCGADLYRVAYDFTAWPDWRAIWEVSGPRKDYRMESLYRRADRGGMAAVPPPVT